MKLVPFARSLLPVLFTALCLAAVAGLVQYIPAHAEEKRVVIEDDISRLPDRVREMYDAILDAAGTGEIEEMRPVLESNELMPQVSFGGATDPITFWKQASGDKQGREILAILIDVLEMPYIRINPDTDDEMYVWPYLAEADLDKLTPDQEVDLYRLVSPAEAKVMREFGGYIWYRLGIGRDGTWHFFVTGD